MSRDHNKILQVPSPTDGSLKRLLRTLFEDHSLISVRIKMGISAFVTIDGVSDAKPEPESDVEKEENSKDRSLDSVMADIDSVFEGTSETSVSTHRIEFFGSDRKFCTFERVRTMPIEIMGPNGRSSIINYYAAPDYRVAEFYFDHEGSAEAHAFNKAISKIIRPSSGSDSGEGGPDGLNAVLSRMTAVSSGMMEDLAKSQLAQEARMTALMESQTGELEKQKAALNAAHQKNVEALDKRSIELDEREKEMDNASTRSTRRKLRGAITGALKENQQVEIIPESARKVRTPILWIAGIGIAASLIFSSWSFLQVSAIPKEMSGSALNWYLVSLLLRGSLGIFAGVAIGLSLLRYLRSIEADAGRRALALEQNLFDIDRASWVIETVMELKEEEGMTSVPGPWLEGVTRGLFQHNHEIENDSGPVDALVGLMGSGMALKLNSGDAEISFDSKASKAAAKSQSKTS